MYFAEIVVLPAILFSPKIKVATRKTAIYIQLSGFISGNLNDGFCITTLSIESLETKVAVILRICGRILNHIAS